MTLHYATPQTIHVLELNDMRMPQIETLSIVCWSCNRERLERWVEEQRVEPYTTEHDGTSFQTSADGYIRVMRKIERGTTWSKVYRQGSPLEWYNPPVAHGGSFGGITSVEAVLLDDGSIWLRAKVLAGALEVST